MRAAGYVRVSRVGGREGERFISSAEQRRKIEGWAALHDAALVEIVEELDVSGGRAVEDRELDGLIRRCEASELEGIVAYRLDRFSRSTIDTLNAVKRLRDCGARLVTVEDGIDTATTTGDFVLTILAALAEQQRTRIRESWNAAVGAAVRRGVHVGPTPAGYVRTESGRLEPDPETAPFVAAAFRMRAHGTSWGGIADFLTDHDVLPHARGGRRSVRWSRTGVVGLIRNTVYKGESHSREHVNPNAHPPLVSVDEWEAAQPARRDAVKRGDKLVGKLKSLTYCAGCGHKLVLTGTAGREAYHCRRSFSTGICPSPAAVSAARLDSYVMELALQALERGELDSLLRPAERLAGAQERVDATEAELDAFMETGLASVIGAERFREEVERRQTAVDDARAAWSSLLFAVQTVAVMGGRPTTRQETARLIQDEPDALRAVIERVDVDRADPARRRWQPLPERVQVIWRVA